MFETRMQIRQAARAKVRAEGRRDVVDALRRYAVRDEATGRIVLALELTPEVEATLLNGPDDRG